MPPNCYLESPSITSTKKVSKTYIFGHDLTMLLLSLVQLLIEEIDIGLHRLCRLGRRRCRSFGHDTKPEQTMGARELVYMQSKDKVRVDTPSDREKES